MSVCMSMSGNIIYIFILGFSFWNIFIHIDTNTLQNITCKICAHTTKFTFLFLQLYIYIYIYAHT